MSYLERLVASSLVACRWEQVTRVGDVADVLGRDVAEALLDALAQGSDPHAPLLHAVASRGASRFVLPGFEQYPDAQWWSGLQPEPGSFLTLALAAVLHAGGVNGDEWLDRATSWSWRSIETTERPGGYWLKYARGLVSESQVEAHLDAVESGQQADGGWMFDWLPGRRRRRPTGAATSRFERTWLRDNGRP